MVILTTFLSLTISEIQQVVSKLKGRADLEERKLNFRKIVSESQAMVNGLDSNGFNETLSKPNPFSSFPTPTQSAWTASIDKWFGTTTYTNQSNTMKISYILPS
jgi:hypothetical protein